MLSSRIHKISAGMACLAAAFAGAAVSGTAGATSADDVPTFQEFEAAAYVDTGGQYVVNGDEPVANRHLLREFYDSMLGPDHTAEDGLIVNTVGGQDDVWSAAQAGNLTYCVSSKFGADHDAVVTAMAQGAALWESASSAIDYVYDATQDDKCTTRNRSVLFSVEPVNTTQYIARAFFPSSPDRQRNVLVDDSIWSAGNWESGDIMAHELGHTLGFRHEHTRPESGTCFEDNNWRPLTPYDSSSIMHYPQCNGASSDLEFSSHDRQGVQAMYGA